MDQPSTRYDTFSNTHPNQPNLNFAGKGSPDSPTPTENDVVCERCMKIGSIINSSVPERCDMFQVLEDVENLAISTCGVCRLLGAAIQEHREQDPSLTAPLLHWVSVWGFTTGCVMFHYGDPNSIVRAYEPDLIVEFSSPQEVEAELCRRCPQKIDFQRVKSWIDECRVSHSQCTLEPQEQLHELRVIDCVERTVVLAPDDCKFVALSYVWGHSNGHIHFESFQLPAVLPRTIEDSIMTTQLLGHRYLWVDKFCIEQENTANRHFQIRQMDVIYASADLTLIAAAGKDPSYGLPGVSTQRTLSFRCVTIGPATLVRYPLRSGEKIERSAWFNRAWTLQENYLSRRRLYFTDHEVLFVCNEADRLEVPMRHRERSYGLQKKLPKRDFSLEFNLQEAMKLLEQYTTRRLSFESDALNALLGILNHLRSRLHPIGSFWGIPFTVSDSDPCFLCMYWWHPKQATRRPGFPSWSPLGWIGSIFFCKSEDQYRLSRDHVVRLRNLNGNNSNGKSLPYSSPYLEVTAYMVRLPIVDLIWSDHTYGTVLRDGQHIVLPFTIESDGFDAYVPINWDTSDIGDQGSTFAICAITYAADRISNPRSNIMIMILRSHGDFYERIGFADSVRGVRGKKFDQLSHHGGAKCSMAAPKDMYSRQLNTCAAENMLWQRDAKEETILLG